MTWRAPHQEGWDDGPYVRLGRRSNIVRRLIVINVAVFLVELIVDSFARGAFTDFFGLSREGLLRGRVWQVITYMFLHDTGYVLHLLFNMLVLYFMGPETERAIGGKHFLALYVLCGVLGGLGWILIERHGLCIGASGAVFGVLGAFATLFPRRQVTLLLFFVLPVTMQAWVMAVGLALIELAMLAGGSRGNVAHAVHVGGVMVGAIYAWVVFRRHGSLRSLLPGRGPRLRFFGEGDAAPDVDRILDKIASEGIGSLTARERETLTRASRDRQDRL